jgi:hypothetical protein
VHSHVNILVSASSRLSMSSGRSKWRTIATQHASCNRVRPFGAVPLATRQSSCSVDGAATSACQCSAVRATRVTSEAPAVSHHELGSVVRIAYGLESPYRH